MTAPKPTVVEALIKVMEDVGAVRKGERNQQQNFNFRGIDAVVNACSPAFKKHGVIVIPRLLKCERSTVEVGTKRTLMGHVAVEVEYTFFGPAGDSIPAVTPGEAMDSGDKATAKAMSVAFRTALLQALSLPTDDPVDPDGQVYERAPRHAPEPAREPEPMPDLAALADAIFIAKDPQALRDIWKQNERVLDVEHNGKTIRQRILDRQAALAPPPEQAEVPGGAE